MKKVFSMLKEAASDWSEDNAPRLGAALAYYTVFSLAPLLLIAIGIAGMVFGEEAARGQIVHQIDGLVGKSGAEAIQSMLENARKPGAGIMATVIGAITLFVGATGAFGELRAALNTIWEVPQPPSKGILTTIRERFISFSMVLVVGFLLLVSLLMATGLAAVGEYFGGLMPGMVTLLNVLNVVISLVVITVLFAMIYKVLPDTDIEWRDVWVGALITSALFTVGKFAIGLYLGKSSMSSSYGAAGSFVVLLVWVYYASQILFFGAELTQVYASRYGSRKLGSGRAAAAQKDGESDEPSSKRERAAARRGEEDELDEEDDEDDLEDPDEDEDVERHAAPMVLLDPQAARLSAAGEKPAVGTAFLVTALVAGAVWVRRLRG